MDNSDIDIALGFLDDIGEASRDVAGVTRVAYGPGEEQAHRRFAEIAAELGARVEQDAAGNSFARLDGANDALPLVVTGSHLDSVPQGGNFDGAAGVAAGLACLSALRRMADRRRGFVVSAFRGEESCWFPHSYIGSRMALGRLPAARFDDLKRSDSGKSLGWHIDQSGYDAAGLRAGPGQLNPANVDSFVELHIEQGPVLDSQDLPLGIVTAVAGGHRFREMTVTGEWTHAGAMPFGYRKDAMAAAAAFIAGANELWAEADAEGRFHLLTFGIVATDTDLHAFSRVAGLVRLNLDLRAVDRGDLDHFFTRLQELIADTETRHGVRFELGPDSGPPILPMSDDMIAVIEASANQEGVATRRMPSGAGHDAVAFAEAGVPTGMIFVRNQNGSHNPAEAMRSEDFAAGCRVMKHCLARRLTCA